MEWSGVPVVDGGAGPFWPLTCLSPSPGHPRYAVGSARPEAVNDRKELTAHAAEARVLRHDCRVRLWPRDDRCRIDERPPRRHVRTGRGRSV